MISKFLRIKGGVYILHNHVDLFVAAPGRVLLQDRSFYAKNRRVLDSAARVEHRTPLIIPTKETRLYPANLLPLEPNTAMVDRAAVQTIALLRRNGVEVIPTAVSLEANRMGGGGLRCMVNEM
jgi:N-dimethylarginine dimethylaminohydrolase